MTDTLLERIVHWLDSGHGPADRGIINLVADCQQRIEELEALPIRFDTHLPQDRERIQKLDAELAVTKHAEDMLRHDLGEANRIHNVEMNRMSAELQAAKDHATAAERHVSELISKDEYLA